MIMLKRCLFYRKILGNKPPGSRHLPDDDEESNGKFIRSNFKVMLYAYTQVEE